MDALIDLLQWPAMAVTVAASWFVGSSRPGRRRAGFWLFFVSNAAWVGWGLHAGAWALVLLQFCLAALNLRGVRKAEKAGGGQDPATDRAGA